MEALRQIVLLAACAVAVASGVARAQNARGTAATAGGDRPVVATNVVQGVGAAAASIRHPADQDRPSGAASGRAEPRGVAGSKDTPQGVPGAAKTDSQGVSGAAKNDSQGVSGAARQEAAGGRLVSQEREVGGGQQRNLEVIMDFLGGRPAPSLPPQGGGGMKAASELGVGNAPYPPESRTPPDSRGVLKMDPNQQRKTGS